MYPWAFASALRLRYDAEEPCHRIVNAINPRCGCRTNDKLNEEIDLSRGDIRASSTSRVSQRVSFVEKEDRTDRPHSKSIILNTHGVSWQITNNRCVNGYARGYLTREMYKRYETKFLNSIRDDFFMHICRTQFLQFSPRAGSL